MVETLGTFPATLGRFPGLSEASPALSEASPGLSEASPGLSEVPPGLWEASPGVLGKLPRNSGKPEGRGGGGGGGGGDSWSSRPWGGGAGDSFAWPPCQRRAWPGAQRVSSPPQTLQELSYQGSLESPALPPNPPRSSALSYQGSPNQCAQSLCVTNSSLQTLLFQDSFLLYPLLPHTMSCVHCFTLCSFCFHGPTQTCTNALVVHPQKASVLRTPETTPEPYIYIYIDVLYRCTIYTACFCRDLHGNCFTLITLACASVCVCVQKMKT